MEFLHDYHISRDNFRSLRQSNNFKKIIKYIKTASISHMNIMVNTALEENDMDIVGLLCICGYDYNRVAEKSCSDGIISKTLPPLSYFMRILIEIKEGTENYKSCSVDYVKRTIINLLNKPCVSIDISNNYAFKCAIVAKDLFITRAFFRSYVKRGLIESLMDDRTINTTVLKKIIIFFGYKLNLGLADYNRLKGVPGCGKIMEQILYKNNPKTLLKCGGLDDSQGNKNICSRNHIYENKNSHKNKNVNIRDDFKWISDIEDLIDDYFKDRDQIQEVTSRTSQNRALNVLTPIYLFNQNTYDIFSSDIKKMRKLMDRICCNHLIITKSEPNDIYDKIIYGEEKNVRKFFHIISYLSNDLKNILANRMHLSVKNYVI